MAGPLIAIVGSFDPARDQELGLRNGPFAMEAGERLGQELARQGFRIVVHSSPAPHAGARRCQGLRGPEGDRSRIHPGPLLSGKRPAEFPEEKGNEEKFDFRPDFNPDWEFSFYQSLSQVDGMVILGGDPSALIAGLVAMGHRKPILPCAAFGGSGDKICELSGFRTIP